MAKKEEVNLDIGDKNQVAVTPEDVQECSKFFQFFEIPVPEKLQKAIDAFVADPSLHHQQGLREEIASIIVLSKHPVFQDEVFGQVKPETAEEHEKILFERQIEETFMGDAEE